MARAGYRLKLSLCSRRIRPKIKLMKINLKIPGVMTALAVAVAGGFIPQAATAQQTSPTPFTTTLSNTIPLVFGMSPDEATAALGTPLVYVDGPPGSETYLTTRDVGGSGFTFRHDPLYLQFRDGRLTGWKADWSRNWMWK